MTKNFFFAIAFLTGLGLIFIGIRFLAAPEIAEIGYGIRFKDQGDYSFHYIKGIRDVFSGLLIGILALSKQTKALAIALLAGTIVPLTDMLIVLNKDYNGVMEAIPHMVAAIVCSLVGLVLLTYKKEKNKGYNSLAKIQPSEEWSKESIITYNITPKERTPWHYHTLFSETFEVLKGTLEVGRNREVHQMRKGDIATIEPNEQHYFHNISNDDCLIKVTIRPGNRNFEKSLLILKGLMKEGLATGSGVPRKLSDLALFIYLNNSRMVGLQKIAEPFFNHLARRAIKTGRLRELELRYGSKHTIVD